MEIKMIIKCPCGKKLRATHEQMGKKARCPSCKRILLIPIPRPAQEKRTTAAPQLLVKHEGKTDARKSDVEAKCNKPVLEGSEGTNRNSQGANSPTVQSPNMPAWPFPKTPVCVRRTGRSDKQEIEDRSSLRAASPSGLEAQAGSLWSRSIIEGANQLCPHCQKRVPDSFDRCSHCGKYFNETQQEDDHSNIENSIGRPKFKFMSTLHKVFRRGAA